MSNCIIIMIHFYLEFPLVQPKSYFSRVKRTNHHPPCWSHSETDSRVCFSTISHSEVLQAWKCTISHWQQVKANHIYWDTEVTESLSHTSHRGWRRQHKYLLKISVPSMFKRGEKYLTLNWQKPPSIILKQANKIQIKVLISERKPDELRRPSVKLAISDWSCLLMNW